MDSQFRVVSKAAMPNPHPLGAWHCWRWQGVFRKAVCESLLCPTGLLDWCLLEARNPLCVPVSNDSNSDSSAEILGWHFSVTACDSISPTPLRRKARDNEGMAATVVEGTARKHVHENASPAPGETIACRATFGEVGNREHNL